MLQRLIGFVIQYAGYLLEVALFLYILLWGQGRRLFGVCLFLASLLLVDSFLRPYTLAVYGLKSVQYYYVYWLSDVLLALESFLLICFFYRRAFYKEQKLWHQLRAIISRVEVARAAKAIDDSSVAKKAAVGVRAPAVKRGVGIVNRAVTVSQIPPDARIEFRLQNLSNAVGVK